MEIFAETPTCETTTMSPGLVGFTCDPPPLFSGDPVNGPGSITYEVAPLAAGTYHLQALNPDLAPEMSATLTVVESASPSGA